MKKLLLKILKTQNITITESFEFQRDKYATVSEIKKNEKPSYDFTVGNEKWSEVNSLTEKEFIQLKPFLQMTSNIVLSKNENHEVLFSYYSFR